MKKPITNSQLAILVSLLLIITSPITIHAGQVIIQGVWQFSGAVSISGTVTSTSGGFLAPDGTSLLPSFGFTSQPTLGFYKDSAGSITDTGVLKVLSTFFAEGDSLFGASLSYFRVPAAGNFSFNDPTITYGSRIKVDALPTVSSGFGTLPTITAGSTPFAGSVNVGTGAAATSGVVLFGGTAFPSTPFCVVTNTLSSNTLHVTPTATQLTITASAAWTASDIVNWICVSSK